MRFQAEEGTNTITIGGYEYTIGDDGFFECHNDEHHSHLRQLGCRSEEEIIVIERVVAVEPPGIPEGYVDPETVRALIEECEDQKIALSKAHGDLTQANSDLQASHHRVTALEGELSSARLVEDQLRERIQELDGQLSAATDQLSAATETASETADGGTGGEGSADASATTEVAPPATGKAKAK